MADKAMTKDRLFGLRMRLNELRKDNMRLVMEEETVKKEGLKAVLKRERDLKKEKEKQKLSEARSRGEDPDKQRILATTAADAEWLEKKAVKKRKRMEKEKDKDITQEVYEQHKRRMRHMKVNSAEYEAAKEAQPDFYRDAGSLHYAHDHKPAPEKVSALVEGLEVAAQKREQFNRRRAFNEDADVDYINKRNMVYNKKLSRFFDKHTVEIKQNLERGTAI
mmetsp:Transcript_25447/g.63851  ORF Transcript_25447/g.63851 Transcript_25447/m.63851 type:complete len:221 (+) Transcript_25447:23-685(+)